MTADKLVILKRELEFLDHGGYRRPVGSRQPVFCMETSVDWKPALFFEDSPNCPKRKYESCDPQRECTLAAFVPDGHKNETVPCRYIPLNNREETIASLMQDGASEPRIEAALRGWLIKNIVQLESSQPSENSAVAITPV